MIKNGFKCIGLGDSKTIEGSEEGSECLPEGWNQQEFYSLRYLRNGELYILLGRKSDANLLLNLLRVKDSCVSNIKFPIKSTVNSIHGSLSEQIPNYQNVMQEINKELIEPVSPGNGREMSTQTSQPHSTDANVPNLQPFRDDNPLRVGPPRVPQIPRNLLLDDPNEVGRRDLDPFAGIGPRGGGMIFDPFPRGGRMQFDPRRPGLGGPAVLPPGAIPPGARFDPFGPPDDHRPQPRPRNPDHDHMQPPDYNDMFM
ncbi:hypothetical protein PV327_006963 [Microctonus hyperodae]|uniref:Proteasome inhibitor PI31 subunit n=1 Tax=Microctonus hyperodae TaxID=165561 RepID=A0AA39F5E8_MICHY|nr:hypothetical protein PV327_006963 [Microctonus hyperodae]